MNNSELSEMLAVGSDQATGNLQRAMRRACRDALTWPVEAASLAETGELTSLPGIGPRLEALILDWLETGAPTPDPHPLRAGFLSYAEVRRILATRPDLVVQGDLQSHTHFSDGGMTLSERAAESEQRGFRYQAITDHSKDLKIAGGMDEEKLARQTYEIDQVNERYAASGFRLLKSIEMNLSPAGEGDMDPASLRELDLVLGSFHSKLRLKEDQTERYLAALANPDIHVLGHPQGRMYNFRAGLSADWGRVFSEASRLGKAVEVDAFPNRQDLRVDLLRIAVDEGTAISIGSDAHWPGQIDFVDYGLAACIEAGVPEDRILNLMDDRSLKSWVDELRDRQGE